MCNLAFEVVDYSNFPTNNIYRKIFVFDVDGSNHLMSLCFQGVFSRAWLTNAFNCYHGLHHQLPLSTRVHDFFHTKTNDLCGCLSIARQFHVSYDAAFTTIKMGFHNADSAPYAMIYYTI